MTETQRRIKELKAALPDVKEKVVAVAVLLAMSIAMMASVSYAWYTLSLAPELGGVNTTVSANGNLEIALSDLDGLEPDSSAVGDSFAADGQRTKKGNITWGNLINLSSDYGIDSLILRPATLDTQSDALLSGVKYGGDGRVEGAATDFAFTTWMITNQQLGTYGFGVSAVDAFGVRAISSVGYPDGKGALQQIVSNAQEIHKEAFMAYNRIMGTDEYITAIEGIVQLYLNANVDAFLADGTDVDVDCSSYVPMLSKILNDFYDNAVLKYGEALVYLANSQQSFENTEYETIDHEDLISLSNSQLSALGINLGNSLSIYKTMESQTRADKVQMAAYADAYTNYGTVIMWSDIQDMIDNLISISTVTVDGKTVSQILALGSGLVDYALGLKSPVPIILYGGNLRRFELLCGNRMDVNISFYIMSKLLYSKTGNMKTNLTATDVSKFSLDLKATEEMSNSSENKGNMVADDTYGMVIDLWFRTNAGSEERGTVLTLDGTPKIETHSEQRMIILSGETTSRPVYAYAQYNGVQMQGVWIQDEVLVYKGDDGYYYDITTYEIVYQTVLNDEKTEIVQTTTPITDADVTAKMDTYEEVIGFESSNRIWNDGEVITNSTEISATQGSGSCYVFYADTPEAYASAAELLAHMKIAFMDVNGNLLAQAEMDLDHVYGESGKYTVPLTITSSTHITTNDAGETIYGVTTLQKNVAQRISVVVYLEGEGLENDMVMANESITGGLNLQFSTTEDLRALEDTALAMDTISLRTEIKSNYFEAGGNKFTYDGTAKTATLTAYVEGLDPSKVQAVFQRQINATQGTRMNPVTLNNTSGTEWVGDCSFLTPGTYVLNSLLVDGVEYALPEQYKITVTVEGFAVSSVSFCDLPDEKLALTANNSVSRDIAVSFGSTLQPSKVEARIVSSDGSFVSATLKQDLNGYWTGTANFTSSGTYTIQYLVLDGQYFELESAFQKAFTAYLGLRTQVQLSHSSGDTVFILEYDDAGNVITQNVNIKASILTDTGDTLKGLEGIKLYYTKRGSSLLENGLSADLTWSGGYYVGTFNVDEGGIFNFAQMQAGANVLTNATSAPTITCRDVKPVKYVGSFEAYSNNLTDTPGLLVMTDSSPVYYVAQIVNADTATDMQVLLKDPSGKVHTVPVTKFDGDAYYFQIPTSDTDGKSISMHGVWQVMEIRMGGVYDAEGNYYGTDFADAVAEYYSILPATISDDSSDGEAATVAETAANIHDFTIVNSFDVAVTNGLTLGSEDSAADFLASQSLAVSGGIAATVNPSSGLILDLDNNGIDDVYVTDVKLILTHVSGSNDEFGHYTFTGTTGYETIECDMVFDEASQTWIIDSADADAYAHLAGTYNWQIKFKVTNGGGYTSSEFTGFSGTTVTGKADKVLTVYSDTPEVRVDAITTTGSIDVYTGNNNDGTKLRGSFANKTDYFATVYISHGTIISSNVTAPTVTLKIYDMPDLEYSASMVFSNSIQTTTYTFAPGQETSQNTIGFAQSYEFLSKDLVVTPAGLRTADDITVTIGQATYTVDVREVTIYNPKYPLYVDFVVNDSALSTPARIYGTPQADGRFTITLPTVANGTSPGSETLSTLPTSLTGLAAISGPSTDKVYTGNWVSWKAYSVTTTVYEATASTRTWTNTHEVDYWTDETNQYTPDEYLTIDAATTLTAHVKVYETPGTSATDTGTYHWTVVEVTEDKTGSFKTPPSDYNSTSNTPTAQNTGWVLVN